MKTVDLSSVCRESDLPAYENHLEAELAKELVDMHYFVPAAIYVPLKDYPRAMDLLFSAGIKLINPNNV